MSTLLLPLLAGLAFAFARLPVPYPPGPPPKLFIWNALGMPSGMQWVNKADDKRNPPISELIDIFTNANLNKIKQGAPGKSGYDLPTTLASLHTTKCMMKDADKKERESTPPPYHSSHTYKEHLKFYTKDVFFQLDNTLYKFPEYYFRDSLVFLSLKTFRDYAGISGEGTFESPFTCTKIDKKALESFISLQRTAVYDQGQAISGNDALDILKVSYFWKMKELGEFAVDRLTKAHLDGLEKMKLAKRYNIQNKKWRYSAIRELISMPKLSFTEADVEDIGAEVALKITKLHGMHMQRWILPVSDENIKIDFQYVH